jgi:hypothetical protein
MTLKVECYSGYKGDERPLRFLLGERWYQVEEVADRWYSPGCSYFRVKAEDGHFYILRLDENTQEWTLASYRAGPA